VTLNRPYYADTRNSVGELSSSLKESIKTNEETLLNMILSDKEAEPLKKEIST
jgi:hypothetical protein